MQALPQLVPWCRSVHQITAGDIEVVDLGIQPKDWAPVVAPLMMMMFFCDNGSLISPALLIIFLKCFHFHSHCLFVLVEASALVCENDDLHTIWPKDTELERESCKARLNIPEPKEALNATLEFFFTSMIYPGLSPMFHVLG